MKKKGWHNIFLFIIHGCYIKLSAQAVTIWGLRNHCKLVIIGGKCHCVAFDMIYLYYYGSECFKSVYCCKFQRNVIIDSKGKIYEKI